MQLFIFTFHGNLEYHRDELLYFSLGQHPAFGYATVPPMIGWIAWVMQNIFGYSLFAVRIFPAIMSGVMVFLVSAIAKELGGSGYSRILAAVRYYTVDFRTQDLSFVPACAYRPYVLDADFLPDNKIYKHFNGLLPYPAGIIAGAALLNKYLIGLLIIILTGYCPVYPTQKYIQEQEILVWSSGRSHCFPAKLIWQIVNGLPV